MNFTTRVVVVAADPQRRQELVAALDLASYSIDSVATINVDRDIIRPEPPQVFVVDSLGITTAGLADLYQGAILAGSAVLVVTSGDIDPSASTFQCSDWLAWDHLGSELAIRTARLLRHDRLASPLADPRFMALIVHDLRTPLNVFTLTIRALSQSIDSPTPDLEEDLSFLSENSKQIERMLAQLGDYSRLIETQARSTPVEFQTRRFLADFLEEKQSKRDPEFKSVRLEMMPEMPEVAELDPARARAALYHALANATAATPDASIRLRSGGSANEWLLEIIVDKPSPATVSSTDLRPGSFERLIGSAAERRGFDLAIAALVTQSFGGSARLEVESGTRSTIQLSWPTNPQRTR